MQLKIPDVARKSKLKHFPFQDLEFEALAAGLAPNCPNEPVVIELQLARVIISKRFDSKLNKRSFSFFPLRSMKFLR
jgi:hypothetical protein